MLTTDHTMIARVESKNTTLELRLFVDDCGGCRFDLRRRRRHPGGRSTYERSVFTRAADLRAHLGSGRLSRELYRKAGWS